MTEGMAAIMSPTMLENMSPMLSSSIVFTLFYYSWIIFIKLISRVLVLVEGL